MGIEQNIDCHPTYKDIHSREIVKPKAERKKPGPLDWLGEWFLLD